MNERTVERMAERVQSLVALFEHIAATRMAGVPVIHPGLRVQAVGFEPQVQEGVDGDEPGALGVLITPWFMNLVWLPLEVSEAPRRVGVARERQVGGECFEFIAAHEPGFGFFEACSLFSPMFQFVDHEAACATALAALESLRGAAAAPQAASTPAPASAPAEPPPARRSFLFGRSATAAERTR